MERLLKGLDTNESINISDVISVYKINFFKTQFDSFNQCLKRKIFSFLSESKLPDYLNQIT